MEPNPGDIYNEGYEAGYKAGKEEIEAAVEAEKRRIWGEIVKMADDYSGELDTNLDNIRTIIGLHSALTPTKTDKQ